MRDKVSELMDSKWRHAKTRREYRVTKATPVDNMVYLTAETKGAKSIWKYAVELPLEYEPIA